MIHIKGLTFGYAGRPLLDGASLHVRPGDRLGLVGPNGSGKTTLFKILSGEITEYDGAVDRRKSAAVALLPQEARFEPGETVLDSALGAFGRLLALEREIEELRRRVASAQGPEREADLRKLGEREHLHETGGGFDFRRRTKEVLSGLGFSEADRERETAGLSGGWRMRVALAKLLLQNPDVALLDEPTNHLDLPALVWFESFLDSFEGAAVIVSHDQTFLDRTVRRIAHLNRGRFDLYEGGYTFFEEERERRMEVLENARARQDREIARVERFVERFRYKATKARQVQSRIKSLEKIERIEGPETDKVLDFSFRVAQKSGRVALELRDVYKSYGEKEVLRGVTLTVNRGDRVGVIGANGLGKSTLLKVMAGRVEFQGERRLGHNARIEYFAQENSETLAPELTLLEELGRAAGGEFRGDARRLLGVFLFTGDDAMKKVAALSGGEKSRLALAKILANPVNLLLLDEPTNHLDPSSRRAIERALLSYDGSLCFVTHDRAFLNALATRIVEITPAGVDEYLGNYEDHLAQKEFRAGLKEGDGRGGGKTREAEPSRGEAWREEKKRRARFVQERSRIMNPLKAEIAAVEKDIERLEGEILSLEGLLGEPASYADPETARRLPLELKEARAALEGSMKLWETFHERMEELERRFAEEME